jgi:A/G-specific adenine glycosylase
METASISDYNQGIMEFGALQCVPKSPDCRACPFSHSCAALEKEMVEVLPVKLKKNKVRIRHFNYLVYIDKNGKTILNKRVGKGIWQHLYEFPLVETDTLLEPNEVYNVVPQKKDSKEEIVLWKSKPVVHKLSHQHLITRFWIIETKDEFTNGIALDQLGDYPVPVLLSEFLDTFKNSYF